MGFEALSCAIARVIINYHADKTQTALLNTDRDDALEHILNCPINEINQTLKTKIAEATTGNNSSRLTLLQYMHIGISLSEKARVTEDPDEIEAIKPQLVQFIQNIQLLLTTTSFFSRTLLIPTDEKQNLTIYRLNSSTAQAYKLTQTLLSTIGLSPESTESSVQENINDRFLLTKNQTLSQENAALETVIESLNQDVRALEEKIDPLTASKSTHKKFKAFEPTYETHEAHESKDWELVPDAFLENIRLIAENQALTKHLEAMQPYHMMLSLHHKNITLVAAIKASNETIMYLQKKYEKPLSAPIHDAEDRESIPAMPQSIQSENERLTTKHQRLDACHKNALEKIQSLTDDEIARQLLINQDIDTTYTRRDSSSLSNRTSKTQQPMGTNTENLAVYTCPPSLTIPSSLYFMSIFAPSFKLSNGSSESTSTKSASDLAKHEKFN